MIDTATAYWPTPIETLDINIGDIVTKLHEHLAIHVTDVREPVHPAMPGLAVIGHAYVKGMMRWSDRETAIHDTDMSQRWTRHPADRFEVSDARYADEPHYAVWERQGLLYVHQTMEQVSPILWRYPLSYQRADALARRFMPGARLVSDSEYGMTVGSKWRRLYAVPGTDAHTRATRR